MDLKSHGVSMKVLYSSTLHDMAVRFLDGSTNNTWVVMGRGLDIYEQAKTSLGMDQWNLDLRTLKKHTRKAMGDKRIKWGGKTLLDLDYANDLSILDESPFLQLKVVSDLLQFCLIKYF